MPIAKKPSPSLAGLAELAKAERAAQGRLRAAHEDLAIRTAVALNAGFSYDDIARLTISPTATLSDGPREVNRLRQLMCRYRKRQR